MPWCFEDEQSPLAEALLTRLEADEEALVPSHWALEITNVLVTAKRKGRLSEAQVSAFLEDLRQFAVHIDGDDSNRTFAAVRLLADQHRLTAYDAAYLELALRTTPLATMDNELLQAARDARRLSNCHKIHRLQ